MKLKKVHMKMEKIDLTSYKWALFQCPYCRKHYTIEIEIDQKLNKEFTGRIDKGGCGKKFILKEARL